MNKIYIVYISILIIFILIYLLNEYLILTTEISILSHIYCRLPVQNQILNIYPFGFCIPECKIIQFIPKKSRKFAIIIPGKLKTYIYKNENDYYKGYQESYFGITKLKGGWDCMRHYEILANGCIPVFENLINCPKNTMTFFPKKIIIESNKELLENFSIERYNYYMKLLHEHTLKYLTTRAMSGYMLSIINKNPKKILVLSGEHWTTSDYGRDLILIGLKEIYGDNCHEYPFIPHIYKDYKKDISKLYGKGISYTKILNANTRNKKFDETLLEYIQNHVYDLIIYGTVHHSFPFFKLVNSYYKPNEIIMLCTNDMHNCEFWHLSSYGYNVFVREIPNEIKLSSYTKVKNPIRELL